MGTTAAELVSDARVANASFHCSNATEGETVPMGATRPLGAVVRNAHRDFGPCGVAQAGSASIRPTENVMDSKNARTEATRARRHAGTTAVEWRDVSDARVGNASELSTNATD